MAQTGQQSASLRSRLADLGPRLAHIYHREIWQSAYLRDRTPKGCAFAVLRVLSITLTVFVEARIVTRAAALSFSSLLGLGPLIVIAVLVAGFALGESKPEAIADTLNQMIKIIAPQIQQYEELTQNSTEVNPQLVQVISEIINASKSGKAGAAGIFSLLMIVLLLFKSIEDTFNDIWGVRQGRSIITRIVFYWTILTLGAIVFFTAIALLSATAFVTVFWEKIPGGAFLQSLGILLPMASFTLVALVLTLFYRAIPNTRVFWGAAFIGGLVVGALLMLNNYVAFVYMKRVVLERDLYGSLAIVPVLMFGLYIFWLFVLIGAIVSYAIQNVHFRNSQAAWSTLTGAMRERFELVVFLTICRRFRDCLPPISASHLSEILKVPAQLLNECLNRLVQLKLVATVVPDPADTASDNLYLPARPLNRTTLYDFKSLDENYGEDPIGTSLERIDPLVSHYDTALNKLGEVAFFQKTVDQLLHEHPFDETQATPALGGRERPRAR